MGLLYRPSNSARPNPRSPGARMNINDVQTLEHKLRQGFSYQADFASTPAENHWRSYYEKAAAGETWSGNCSDLTSTILDGLCRGGLNLSDGYFLAVFDYLQHGGHAVGCVKTDDGRMWVVGDTFATQSYPAETMRHKPDIYHRLSEPVTEWRKGVPWKIV
jgi:hypothetical protein